jgi:hypothetical protein
MSSGKWARCARKIPKERADEADRDGDQEAAGGPPGNGATDGTADPRDDEQDEKSGDGEVHAHRSCTTGTTGRGSKGGGRQRAR